MSLCHTEHADIPAIHYRKVEGSFLGKRCDVALDLVSRRKWRSCTADEERHQIALSGKASSVHMRRCDEEKAVGGQM